MFCLFTRLQSQTDNCYGPYFIVETIFLSTSKQGSAIEESDDIGDVTEVENNTSTSSNIRMPSKQMKYSHVVRVQTERITVDCTDKWNVSCWGCRYRRGTKRYAQFHGISQHVFCEEEGLKAISLLQELAIEIHFSKKHRMTTLQTIQHAIAIWYTFLLYKRFICQGSRNGNEDAGPCRLQLTSCC